MAQSQVATAPVNIVTFDVVYGNANEDYQDLLALERDGVSVIRAPQYVDEPVIVTEMPMANTPEDRLEVEVTLTAAGHYDAVGSTAGRRSMTSWNSS